MIGRSSGRLQEAKVVWASPYHQTLKNTFDFNQFLQTLTLIHTSSDFMSKHNSCLPLIARFSRMSLPLSASPLLKGGFPSSPAFHLTQQDTRHGSTMPPPLPTPPPPSVSHMYDETEEDMSAIIEVVGKSGCRYRLRKFCRRESYQSAEFGYILPGTHFWVSTILISA